MNGSIPSTNRSIRVLTRRTCSSSLDGRLLAVAGGDTARILDTATWQEKRTLAHEGTVGSARFTPDGLVVTGSNDGTVRVWDPETGEERRRIEIGWRVADAELDVEGRVVGVGGDGGAGLWSVETGERLASLTGQSAQVLAVRLAHDGSRVATASVDRTIRVWDPSTGVTTLVLSGSGNIVSDIAFSPDGSRLASISDSIRVWVLSIDELIDVANRNVTRSLADEECRQYLHLERCG